MVAFVSKEQSRIRRPRRWRNKMDWKTHLKAPSVGRFLPNIVTIAALCMGLTAVRFAFLKQWQAAVGSVLTAGFLDWADGSLARFLKSSSDFGAELDSLADFINFGVAPSMIIYFFSLHLLGNVGWGLCLFFSACMSLRLARFNIQKINTFSSIFSVGVPAPAGALLALFPMVSAFVFEKVSPSWIFAITILATSIMLVSHYPTFVLKKITISQKYLGIFFVCILGLVTSLVTAPWETLFIVTCAYIITLPVSGYLFYSKKS